MICTVKQMVGLVAAGLVYRVPFIPDITPAKPSESCAWGSHRCRRHQSHRRTGVQESEFNTPQRVLFIPADIIWGADHWNRGGIAVDCILLSMNFLLRIYRPHTSVLGTGEGVDGYHVIAPGYNQVLPV